MGPNHTAIIIVPYRICQGDIIMIIHIQIFDKSNLSYFFYFAVFYSNKISCYVLLPSYALWHIYVVMYIELDVAASSQYGYNIKFRWFIERHN